MNKYYNLYMYLRFYDCSFNPHIRDYKHYHTNITISVWVASGWVEVYDRTAGRVALYCGRPKSEYALYKLLKQHNIKR
jgi:hypothetical protein